MALKFQTYFISSNRTYGLKYLRSTTLGCKDIEKRESEVRLNSLIKKQVKAPPPQTIFYKNSLTELGLKEVYFSLKMWFRDDGHVKV